MVVETAFKKIEKHKKILFVYDRLDIIGGLETRWMDEFSYLKKITIRFFY